MGTKAVRGFFRKSDGKQVWYHELRGSGSFPTPITEDLTELPNKMPDGEIPLGGVPEDYVCIEETNLDRIAKLFASDGNTIVDSKLVIGVPRVLPEPKPIRNPLTEIDELRANLKDRGIL